MYNCGNFTRALHHTAADPSCIHSLPSQIRAATAGRAACTLWHVQFEHMSEQQLDEHAAHAAEYFWWTVRQDLSERKLTRADLNAVLRDSEDADYAFSLFDLDGDGYVVEEEVQSRFQKIYRCASQHHVPQQHWRLFTAKRACSSIQSPRPRLTTVHTIVHGRALPMQSAGLPSFTLGFCTDV